MCTGLSSREVASRVNTHTPLEGSFSFVQVKIQSIKYESINPLYIHTAILWTPTRCPEWNSSHLPRMNAGDFSYHYSLKDLFLLILFVCLCLYECVLCFCACVQKRASAPSGAGYVNCQVVVSGLTGVLGLELSSSGGPVTALTTEAPPPPALLITSNHFLPICSQRI